VLSGDDTVFEKADDSVVKGLREKRSKIFQFPLLHHHRRSFDEGCWGNTSFSGAAISQNVFIK